MPDEATQALAADAAARTKPEPTFTQADLDHQIGERLARERAKYADYDDLRSKASEFDKLQEERKSEVEKLQDRLAGAEEQATAAADRARAALVRAAVVAEASKQGAVDPDAVVALLPKDSVTCDDDGQVTGAGSAVQALLEAKTYLVGKTPDPGPGDGGARPDSDRGITAESLARMTPQQIAEMPQADVAKALAMKQ